MTEISNFVMYWAGLTDPAGAPYLFWSGIGANLTIVSVLWRHLNCHEDGCWRIGRYRHAHLLYCHRHHPIERLKLKRGR